MAPSPPPFKTVPTCITEKFMGTWFVVGVKPTPFETTCSNAVEVYSRSKSKQHDIDVDFQYNKADPISSPLKSMGQKGWIQGKDKENSANWTVSPTVFGLSLPFRLPYPIIELDEKNYEYTVVGNPQRNYVWIMSRSPVMDEKLFESLKKKLVEKHAYNLDGFRKVPQKWTRAERANRKLESIIPDNILVD